MTDIAQISTIALAVVLVALIVVGGFAYRARHAAAREESYRLLAERSADIAQATADELGEVKQRLAALEKLLSQIG